MYWLIGRNSKLSLENNNKTNLDIWSVNLGILQQIQYFHNLEKKVKDATYDCQRSMVCPQYNTS
jgi:hypothetical protein